MLFGDHWGRYQDYQYMADPWEDGEPRWFHAIEEMIDFLEARPHTPLDGPPERRETPRYIH